MLSERRIVQMAIVRSSEGVKFENSLHIFTFGRSCGPGLVLINSKITPFTTEFAILQAKSKKKILYVCVCDLYIIYILYV
jgi:hypothetical protein